MDFRKRAPKVQCPPIGLMTPHSLPAPLKLGLSQLYSGWQYARDLQVHVEAFGVPVDDLQHVGVTDNDLRWLEGRGFATRSISRCAHGSSINRPTIVLTLAGAEWARQMVGDTSHAALPVDQVADTPLWDARLRELSFRGQLVKRFRVPAPAQELILATFQEEEWPRVIDDPLPPLPGVCPKRRLHDVIAALNRSHLSDTIRFKGTGLGKAVAWTERVAPQTAHTLPTNPQ